MVLAGVAFAALNVATQWLSMTLGFPPARRPSGSMVSRSSSRCRFASPRVKAMKTAYPVRHILRVLLAAFGVQAWVTGLATVPIWQAIALVMTSPFFIIIGARLFLARRSVATAGWQPSLGLSGP